MTNYNKETNPQDYEFLLNKIESIENRLKGIESLLKIEWRGKQEALNTEFPQEEKITNNTESTIIEHGLAWLGSIVLIFGIIFLMSYMDSLGNFVTSRIIAYTACLILVAFTYFFRRIFPILVNTLTICLPLLIFYITTNLYFFTNQVLLSSPVVETSLLIVIVCTQYYLALRLNSEFLGLIAIFLSVATAIISDSTNVTLAILIITSAIALILFYKKIWWRLLIFSVFTVYLTHLIWLFNNPVMGNTMRIVDSSQFNILFLFGYGIIYASSIFISNAKIESKGILISVTICNALLFSMLLSILIIPFYKESYGLICGALAIFCIIFSVFLKLKSTRIFAPATYACFGFMALSAAIYGFSGMPNTYFLLVLQSFLVVSMALWFRSKIIVIVNTFLFIAILLLYLFSAIHTVPINFVFAITALATARILNWKKERLTLKTEMYRNLFLFVGFFMLLYSLSHALPNQYVTLSWTAAAIVFFILSLKLKNMKYRYMSISTIIITGGHLFFVDLRQLELGYRVIAFMVFAIISLVVSLYYSKRIHDKTT